MGILYRSNHIVDLKFFKDAGVPYEVGKVFLTPDSDRQYILRMPICVDGYNFHVPKTLEWIQPMLIRAKFCQQVKHSFCYVTVRHGLVTSETDDEWHVDGFSTRLSHIPEQNYIWSNKNPTEYADISVDFPKDFDPLIYNVNHYLAKHIDESKIETCKENTIYMLDPYHVHRRPKFTSEMHRTFVRISFVPIEINDINNTQNPLLPRVYDRDGIKFRNKLLTYS